MADIKKRFMVKALTEYHERVIAAMRRSMASKGVHVTGEAERSLAYQVYEKTAGAEGKLSFAEYLRMVDMGAGRGHPLGGLKAVRIALKASNRTGMAFRKDNTRKPKKVYSKIAYGELSFLQNQLLYGYTEEVIAELKKELINNG